MLAASGCAANTAAAPRTVIVTETAAASGDTGSTTGVTVSPLPSTTDSPTVSVSGDTESSSSESTTSVSMAPIVKLNPLKADCAKVMNATELTSVFGTLPTGTGHVNEGKTANRKIVGKLKCQYGVSDDKSTVAVSIVLAQFDDAAAAESQVAMTEQSETQAGAKASTTNIQGHPANVLLRDGGLLQFVYDTWTLSVVVDKNVMSEAQLPAALAEIADYALSKVISQGG